jgi:hypothetical protein
LQLRVTDSAAAAGSVNRILTVNGSVPDLFPAPVTSPVPVQPQSSSQSSSCAATLKTRIARLKRKLRTARRNLARAHSAKAKRRYRSQVKSLSKRLKRLRATAC